MAENSRLSKLSEKDDEYIFTWKLFTAWDFMIGNPETAHNRIASIVMGFKEALVEEAEKKRESRKYIKFKKKNEIIALFPTLFFPPFQLEGDWLSCSCKHNCIRTIILLCFCCYNGGETVH